MHVIVNAECTVPEYGRYFVCTYVLLQYFCYVYSIRMYVHMYTHEYYYCVSSVRAVEPTVDCLSNDTTP